MDWSFVLYRAGSFVVSGIPRPIAIFLASICGRVAARLLPARQAIVRANLSRVVGAIPTVEMDRLVRRAFVEYARYWMLSARFAGALIRDRTRGVSISGRHHYIDALQHRGVIFAVPHIGLWDAGGLVSVIEGFPIATVAEEASSPKLTAWFARQRKRLGLDSYAPGPETTTALINLLRANGAVALVADRDVVGDGLEVRFFGEMTRVPAGPIVLALRSGATVLPSAVFLRPKGRVEIAIGAPLPLDRRGKLRDDLERITTDLVARYEEMIRSAPEQWHVFQPIWPSSDASTIGGDVISSSPDRVEVPRL